MARLEVGRAKWCSYKRTTLVICSINIVIALYVLRSIYSSLYLYSGSSSTHSVKYTLDQLKKMEESMRIRKASEPLQLIKVVNEIKQEFGPNENGIELSQHVKQMIRDEILQKLRSLPVSANVSLQRDAIESWRREKLQEAKSLTTGQANITSVIPQDEAETLVQVMESKWPNLVEELGVFIPTEYINKVHDDKPEGVDEFEEDPLPGKPVPSECNAVLHTDYGGAAVRWGLTHHKESAAECCQACLDQAKRAKPGEMKCNIWVYCPSETGCYSPDIYEHKNQECWLKYDENPKLSFKDKYSDAYRSTHPTAPLVVPWVSGIVSARPV
ncbi:hypothetical protein V2J09_007161 [Rumex salicifolius]